MKIVADENIPYVREAFASLGDVVTLSGRAITRETLRDADMLLVRSIRKVNRALLEGTPVRFVASATIGEDHVDKDYLAEKGIGFSSAPGCNANSVGDYIVSALLALELVFPIRLASLSLGIVGVGNVGGNVWKKAEALGLRCVLNDPPLARETGNPIYRPLSEIFNCDIVTVHVPLTREGEDATYQMVNADFFSRMKPGAFFINTSRGAVVDEAALHAALDSGKITACVLDVWQHEPDIDVSLLEKAFIGTPHIAGYSFDGKVNGTRQIYEAACRFLNREADWDPSPLLPPPDCEEVIINGAAVDRPAEIRKAVFSVYDVRKDDAAMRGILQEAQPARGKYFDALRKNYPRRREYLLTRVRVEPQNQDLVRCLAGLGFISR